MLIFSTLHDILIWFSGDPIRSAEGRMVQFMVSHAVTGLGLSKVFKFIFEKT